MIEGRFPGFIQETVALGAVLAPPGHYELFTDGVPVDFPDVTMLMVSRPLLENRIRRRVSMMPNVEIQRAQATGFRYRDQAVSAPRVQRVPVGIRYATAMFSRRQDPPEPETACALNQFTTPASDALNGLAALAVCAIERSRWQVVAMAYGRDRSEPTVDELRSISAGLPEVFREATAGDPMGDVAAFYYRESVRRSVLDPEHFAAGLVRIGDAVASFNPIHGSGILSAAIQASVLAEQLANESVPAMETKRCVRLVEAAVDEMWKAETNVCAG
jgi:2-polyprenyl-6-methoxyphenol hydroxylase-like FAD-dependent oxidoreductase